MQISIRISGDKETIKALQKMGASFFNYRREMQEIGKLVKDYAGNETMASQGGALGTRWARLSPRYAAWKARNYPGRPPLVRTGHMQKSYEFDAKDQSVTIRNAADYFEFHQLGTRHMPQRLALAINSIQKRSIVNIIDAGTRRKIDGAMR